jgi:hypothetical protein
MHVELDLESLECCFNLEVPGIVVKVEEKEMSTLRATPRVKQSQMAILPLAWPIAM